VDRPCRARPHFGAQGADPCVMGARPVVVTHLKMRSSSGHPFLRLGALTSDLTVACPELQPVRQVQSTV